MNAGRWGRGAKILIAAILMVGVLGACGGASGPTDPLAGEYVGSGANGANPAMTALIKRFTELHPSVHFKLNDIDTETSVVNVATGDADFGYIGRKLRPTEANLGLTPIGHTGSALAVNVANPITNLTKAQLADIYADRIRDWAALGSSAVPIKPFVREAGSSTRKTIESYVYGSKVPAYPAAVQEIFESTDTVAAIAAFKGAIGMVTLNAKNLSDPSMKLIGMDGVQPTLANLASGAWTISKLTYMTTSVDPAKVKPAIKALVDFVKSPEGRKIISGE